MRPTIEAFFRDGWRHKRIDIELARMMAMERRQSDSHGMAIIRERRYNGGGTSTSRARHVHVAGTSRAPDVHHLTPAILLPSLRGTRSKNPEKPMEPPKKAAWQRERMARARAFQPATMLQQLREKKGGFEMHGKEIPNMNQKPLEKVSVIPPDEAPTPPAVTPLDMLNRAVLAGADIAMIEKLMALHERWDANQARKAFDEAVAAAKRDIPPITRNVTGHNAKKYADFAAIAKVVDPIIGAHGLSYRFRTTQNDRISVTCILSHKAGHAEETTLSGPADTSGSKNAIQSYWLYADVPAALFAGADVGTGSKQRRRRQIGRRR